MADNSDAEQTAIEDIKQVKTRYWHCIDKKLWDEIGQCFAEDCEIDYPNGTFRGRPEIVQSFRDTLGHGPVSHKGRNLSLEITGDDRAAGTWEADVSMVNPGTNAEVKLRTVYQDEYVRDGGRWLIRFSRMRIVPA